jgi:hypothetical protein
MVLGAMTCRPPRPGHDPGGRAKYDLDRDSLTTECPRPQSLFAMLSQARNIDSKRVVEKIIHLDADVLAAIKKEASRVNFG